MASQMRFPTTDQFLYLLNEFPGLQFHRQDLALPYNRFELELVEPGSRLNDEICRTYRVYPGSAQVPQFTFVQLVILALLSSPVRTLKVREITRWVCDSFPGILARRIQEHAQGVPQAGDCVATLSKWIIEYCNQSETNWQCDLIAVGNLEVRNALRQHDNMPRALERYYRLPWGVEDEKFAPIFNMMRVHGEFGIAPPAPTLEMQARQRTLLMDLPKKIRLRILSSLLTFPNPVSVVWNESRRGPLAAVFIPLALRTDMSRHIRKLPVQTDLLSVFEVCKDFEELGRFAFYSMNTFLVDTKMQPKHPEILRIFLSRIGPKSRELIRSVQFNIDGRHQTDKLVKDCIAKLGESYCLQFITLDVHTLSLPQKARDDPQYIVGLADPALRFQSILRLKGLKHVNIFNHPTAQGYADVCLKSPWATKEEDIIDERIKLEAEEEEKEKQRPTMTQSQISDMLLARKRKNNSLAEHERQLERRKRREGTWAGPAGMTIHSSNVRPILDEDVLIQRPGLKEHGYLGADPRVTGPGVGHGKVYDLDTVWGDNEMWGNLDNILRVLRPKANPRLYISGPAEPKRKKQRIATSSSLTPIAPGAPSPRRSTTFRKFLKKKATKAALPTVPEAPNEGDVFNFDLTEVDKRVEEALALETKYRETMQPDVAKKAALRAVFSKVMHPGVDN